MIKKVDILGIQLDNYTVREAIMCVERYLSNNVLNTIESISLQMLIDSETNPVLKEVPWILQSLERKRLFRQRGLNLCNESGKQKKTIFILNFLNG